MKQHRMYMYYHPRPMVTVQLFFLSGPLLWVYLSIYRISHISCDFADIVSVAFAFVTVTGTTYYLICYLCFFASEIVFDCAGIHRILRKKERQFIPWDCVSVIYMRQNHIIPATDLIVFSKTQLNMSSRQIFKGRQCIWLKRHPEVYFWMTYSKNKESQIKEFAAERIQYCG